MLSLLFLFLFYSNFVYIYIFFWYEAHVSSNLYRPRSRDGENSISFLMKPPYAYKRKTLFPLADSITEFHEVLFDPLSDGLTREERTKREEESPVTRGG